MPSHLYAQLSDSVSRRPDSVALISRHRQLTYGALLAESSACARALAGLGIGKGQTVAILLPNIPEFVVAYYAAAAAGALCVPANPLLKPAELAYIWNDCQARIVITAAPFLDAVLEARAEVGSLEHVVAVGLETPPPGVLSFAALLHSQSGDAIVDLHGTKPEDPAVCLYTSGTEGRPKGALLSHRNLVANCEQIGGVLALDERDNFLCVLPLFHSFAGTVCQNAALKFGARVTLMEQFHPVRVAEAMAEHGVTIFPAVPAIYGAMLQLPASFDHAFARTRLCVSGGAPMPLALMQAVEQRFHTVIVEGDGPTECSPVTSVNPPGGVRKPGTIGLPLPGVEMKIVDDDDVEVPVGEIGEIVVRGENVMLGYLNQPAATAAAMQNGWYHTGDLGTVDSDGYFAIVDRKKDMLIVGGLNVYPREVEEVLHAHPAVADAAVVGGHDARRGELVVAVVSLKPGGAATPRDLIRHCRSRLANYKCPRRVIARDALPRGTTGKVLKRLLKKELELDGPTLRRSAP